MMTKCQITLVLVALSFVMTSHAFEAAAPPSFGDASSYQHPKEITTNDQVIVDRAFLQALFGSVPFNRQQAMGKRNPHLLQSRSLKQYKNCYFSPVQCVLLERRRR